MSQLSPAPAIPTVPAGPIDQTADAYILPGEQISQIDEDPDF